MSGYSYTFTHTDYYQKEKPTNSASTPHNDPPKLERNRLGQETGRAGCASPQR